MICLCKMLNRKNEFMTRNTKQAQWKLCLTPKRLTFFLIFFRKWYRSRTWLIINKMKNARKIEQIVCKTKGWKSISHTNLPFCMRGWINSILARLHSNLSFTYLITSVKLKVYMWKLIAHGVFYFLYGTGTLHIVHERSFSHMKKIYEIRVREY
jgi:hypothetical protein